MYTVSKLYVENKCEIKVYEPEELTPSELQSKVDTNVRLYVSVKSSETQDTVALDYSRLITDYAIVTATSWSDFNSQLTDGLVIGYTTHLPGYVPGTVHPSNPVRVWDAMSTLKTFNIDYADYASGRANIYAFRWNLKDLKLSIMEDAVEYPDLNRCVPIVNGFVCRPVYVDNDLYGLDGAHLCWHTGNHFTPEVQLLDFTHVGDVEIGNIHVEKHMDEKCVYARLVDSSHTWTFTTSKSLYEYTPIIVLSGMMIFSDQYSIKSEHTISVNLNRLPLQKAMALRKYYTDDACTSSGVGFTTDDFQTFLNEEFTKEISGSCFVIFVKTNKLLITREKLVSWRYGVSLDSYVNNGLLLIDATNTVRNYHYDSYSNKRELTVQAMENIYIADYKSTDGQLCFIDNDCKHHKSEDINKSSCTMLYLMGDGDE